MRNIAMMAASGLALGALLTGCHFGEARFEGDLGDRAFDPGGTVFAYVDARDDNLVEEARPRVVVVMTWLAFNPEGDLNDLEGSALEDYKHELQLRDALALVFDDQAEVLPGATFESTVESGRELSDGALLAQLHLAPERLGPASTYADFAPFASRRQVSVTLDEAKFADGEVLTGELVIDVSRSDTDAGDALIGRVEGRFRAPLVDERVAEHNLSLLAVEDVLGVPLPPREQP